ncbi:MAG: FtsX-like permease family protein [Clostridiales bacterium]|nr:FtsX-like permease family protein [Clostridiales bacterium]MDU3244429.1 FtsX-like permease family protein [Clostridiales bacterium]
MRSYHSFSWKEIKAQKVTSALILIAVILSTMMTTVVGQSIGILQALREQQASMLNGIRYASFHNLSEKDKVGMLGEESLSFAGANIALGVSRIKNSGLDLQIREYDKKDIGAYGAAFNLESGKLPQQSDEIALPSDVLKLLGVEGKLGEKITLDLRISLLQDSGTPYEYQAEFTLCGILKPNYTGYVSGTTTGAVGAGAAKNLLPEKYQLYSVDFITASRQDFQKVLDELADKYQMDEKMIQYNWVYLDALNISYRETADNSQETAGFSFMAASGVMVGALVLLAAGLVIYNILKISINKKIWEYGILRAIGAVPGQLYNLVARQLILLCGIGIPIGAAAGILSAGGITKAATSLFSPGIFMAQNQEELSGLIGQNSSGKILPLLVSVIITLAFACIAAMPAARYAANVAPTSAMAGSSLKVKRKNRRKRKIRSFEAFFARLNLKRSPGRSAITILSLVMSITVFVALTSFSTLLDTSRDVQDMHRGDYAVRNENTGFAPEVIEELKKRPELESVSTLKYSLYEQEVDGTLDIALNFPLKQAYETLQIIGIDEAWLKSLVPQITDQQMQDFKDGKSCLVKNPIAVAMEGKTYEGTALNPGDQIQIGDHPLQVAGNCEQITMSGEGFTNGVQIIVFDKIYDKLTGNSSYSEIYPKFHKTAGETDTDQIIEKLCNENPGSYSVSYRKTDRQLEESYAQVKWLAWGLIFFIGFIGLLNIINTTYTSIHTRITEIGVQRAIGMSRRSLYQTFLWEGGYYAVIASVIGAVLGYICTIFVNAATTDTLQLTAVPVMAILQAAAVSIIACLAAACIPLSKIAKMSIVESIESVE